MRKLLVIVSVLTLSVLAAGCGSSSGSDGGSKDATTTTKAKTTTTEGTSEDPGDVTADGYTSAFVINLSKGSKDDGNLVLTEDEATCVAPKFVDAITVKTLQENDVTTADIEKPGFDGSALGLSEAQGEQLVAAFAACDVDIVALFAESLTAGLTPEQQSCVAEKVDPDLTKALLVKTFSTGKSDAEFEAVITDLTAKCDLPG
jgi:hypothetical protein